MPGRHDLFIYAGDSFATAVTVADEDGNAIDITGRTYLAQIRDRVGGVVLASLEADTAGAADGEVVLRLAPAATSALFDGVWDLEEHVGSEVRTLLVGRVRVTKGVTQ